MEKRRNKKVNPKEIELQAFLKDLAKFLRRKSFECKYDDGLIYAEDDSFHITTEDRKYDRIGISFGVWVECTYSSIVTKLLMEHIVGKYQLDVYEPYIPLFDEDGEYYETLFGQEAMDYYYSGLMDGMGEGDNYELDLNKPGMDEKNPENLHVVCAFNRKWQKMQKNNPEFVVKNPLSIDDALDELQEWKKRFSEKKYEVKILPLSEFQKMREEEYKNRTKKGK